MGLAFIDEQAVYVTSYYNRASYDGLRIDQGYSRGAARQLADAT